MPMEERRVKRYLEKISLISKREGQIEGWLGEERDEKTVLAIYKAFQESVEASLDLVAMICRDKGIPPEDDYTNIERVIEAKRRKDSLIRANGLRNRIVHLYNMIDEELAMMGIEELLGEIDGFSGWVEKWVKKSA